MSVTAENRPNFSLAGARRLLKNSFWVASSDVVWRVASVLLFTLVARSLGEVAAGRYTVAFTVVLLAFSLSIWGLDQLLVRDVAQRPESARTFFTQLLLLRTGLSLSAIGILWLATRFWLPYPAATEALIILYGWSLLPDGISDLCQALYMGLEQMHFLPLTSVLTGIVRLVAAGGALLMGGSLEQVFLLLLGVSVLRAFLSLAIAAWLLKDLPWRRELSYLRASVLGSVPFFFVNAFVTAEGLVGVLILSALAGEAAAAYYGAGNTLLSGLAVLPAAYRAAIFPMMSRAFDESRPRLMFLYHRSYLYLVAAVVPIVLTVTFLAPQLMALVGGAAFRTQWPVLTVLIWVLPLHFLVVPNSRYMIITHRQHILAWVMAGALVINIVANFGLVPAFGAVGTALSRVLSLGSFFVVIFVYLDWREMGVNLLAILVRPAIAGMSMALLLWWWEGGLVVPLLLGWLLYATVWWVLGGIPVEDQRALVRSMPWRR